jgi:hypothetical protein
LAISGFQIGHQPADQLKPANNLYTVFTDAESMLRFGSYIGFQVVHSSMIQVSKFWWRWSKQPGKQLPGWCM